MPRTVKVDYIPRVEGEGALYIRFTGRCATEARLKIFEPPRLFEALLVGRDFREVPDIVARICGICPVAYQMSSVYALETLTDEPVDDCIHLLRRLLYCGEWIESHALHIFMLHAPDFLGCADVVELARHEKQRVEAGLKLKKTGNDLVALIGGREIHPVNVRVGGFYKVPARSELKSIESRLQDALAIAVDTVRWVSGFDFPDLDVDYEFVALKHVAEYAIARGRLISNRGLDIPVDDYAEHFLERQVAYSTALHSALRARGSYLVGPLARFSLNYQALPDSVRRLAAEAGVEGGTRNPFRSIIVRALETVFACEESLRLIREYEPPASPFIDVRPRPGVCQACTEAPRGILYHWYEIGPDGKVTSARIVPPTSQNQKQIEQDLLAVASASADLDVPELTHRCEQCIRNYDPCISCATHFLQLTTERT